MAPSTPAARIFLAYAPRAVGLRCAVAYLASGRDAYGWFTGARNGDERDPGRLRDTQRQRGRRRDCNQFYSTRETAYIAVHDGDLHSDWLRDEARCQELARMQEAFRREWLFYRSDPDAGKQLQIYADAELAVGLVNIRFERLNRLSKLQPNWTYYSRDFEQGVFKCLAGHWPLDYGGDDEA